jgi:hypothetical protein
MVVASKIPNPPLQILYCCDADLQYISTDEQTTDILMKPLSKIMFAYLRDKLRLMEIAPLVEKEEMTSSVGREC